MANKKISQLEEALTLDLNDIFPVVINPLTIPETKKIKFNTIQNSLDHGSMLGLSDDDHTQYFNVERHTLLVHTDLGLVPNTRQVISGSGLSGGGDLSVDRTIAVGVSGLGLSTSDDAVILTSSANPGANASILATSTEGYLQLLRLGLGLTPLYPLHVLGSSRLEGNTMIDGDITFIGAQKIETSSDGLTLSPASDLSLSPGGTSRVKATNNVRLQSDNYVSKTTGWSIGYDGWADFRYMYLEELQVRTFIADLEQALAGSQIIAKSVAPLAENFTIPGLGLPADLFVSEFIGYSTFRVFANGDMVRLRQFSRTVDSLTVADCWGTVTYVSTTDGVQKYTFTRSTSTNGGTAVAGTIIETGALVLDYGVSGNGIIETTAIDGLAGGYAPYQQIVSWTTHPVSGSVTRTRLGNLRGIFNVTNEYGLYAGAGVTDASQYLRISNEAIEAHNLPIKMYDGASVTMQFSPTTPSFAMGATLPSAYGTGDGLWMGKDTSYKFRVGDVDGELLAWDGASLFLKSNAYNYLQFTGTSLNFYSGVSSATLMMSLTNTPAITIGRVAASQNNMYLTGGALSIRNNTIERIGMTAAGILTVKDSGGNAVFTFNSTLGAEFTKPLTLATGGGIYQGSGSFATPTTGLKIWNESGFGRIAGYNETVLQWSAGTDGKLYAGGGNVILSSNGMQITSAAAWDDLNSVVWKPSASTPYPVYGKLSFSGIGASSTYGKLVAFNDNITLNDDAVLEISAETKTSYSLIGLHSLYNNYSTLYAQVSNKINSSRFEMNLTSVGLYVNATSLITPNVWNATSSLFDVKVNTQVAGTIIATGVIKSNSLIHSTLSYPFGAEVIRTSTLSVPTSVWTTISWNSQLFDNVPSGYSEMWYSGTPGRVTIQYSGVYLVNAYIRFVANGTGYRAMRITVDAGESVRVFEPNVSGTYDHSLNLTTLNYFAAGSFIQVDLWQNSGVTLNAIATGILSVVRVH
ncbi:MAG: hypothetical protein JXR36_13470 [Bacteroidales bacterium]|nr:hypothetical protein [Bacteroidales bacterium]